MSQEGAESPTRAWLISGEKVRQLTRQKSEEITEHYSAFRLEDFKDMAEAQQELVASFANLKSAKVMNLAASD